MNFSTCCVHHQTFRRSFRHVLAKILKNAINILHSGRYQLSFGTKISKIGCLMAKSPKSGANELLPVNCTLSPAFPKLWSTSNAKYSFWNIRISVCICNSKRWTKYLDSTSLLEPVQTKEFFASLAWLRQDSLCGPSARAARINKEKCILGINTVSPLEWYLP